MEAAVEVAKRDGMVLDLVETQTNVKTSNSGFMQFLFNRVFSSRHLLYKSAGGETTDLSSIVSEVQQTIKTILL